jgi:peptide deformylase
LKSLPIYTYGFDVLRKKTKRLTKIDDKIVELVGNMFYTMHKASGIGLAAPQVGIDLALTVIDISMIEGEEDKKPLTLINPKITDSHGSVIMEEGCLSIPSIRADVERPEKIFVQYQDLDLNPVTIELEGILGRVAQHEIDHLNGVLFLEHLSKEYKREFKEQLDLIKNGGIQTNYVLAELSKKGKKTRKKHLLDGI